MSSPDKVFEALASTTRRRILAYLSEGPLTAGVVAERFDMSQPAISKHLSILESADLIWKKREGQFVKYGMQADNLGGTLAKFIQEVCPPSRALKAERRAENDSD
ncbi:metalloregulator ArsR/SmtB family transcription factor [Octadecabacter sp. CECT 8868]|uniref:metalloregulator ArsR/SmtB family transcription factor n=1 Tax=Octadecabacter algicola TaxID=2909342 RepID=UPI001F3B965D|nr:metalloregulator ArsR/SmtB family transcription factor [Octadecabacter algicola]MCF2905074.1 metalloregulator ArsR/SmtB family transcription factor [Octadecabacter algicola]